MSQADSPRQPPADETRANAPQAAETPPARSALSFQARFSDPEETAVEEYRALSILAVIALGLGLLSVLALLTPALCFLPAAGIVASALALKRIADESPNLVGRKAAVVGLWMSVVCLAAVPVDWNVYRWMIRREAQEFSAAFFDFLRNGEPHKAYQLTVEPHGRRPFDEKLWEHYTGSMERYQELKSFVGMPAVRALLALGDKAEVRYYDTEFQGYAQDTELLKQVYAVTFPEGQGKKTFFVRLNLRRGALPRSHESYWRAELLEGGVRPVALGGTLKTE